jgi:GT2 family glycosyltransferase
MSPAVSVIVPVHGHAALTGRCLDLVLGELPEDAELIVVDDASEDETPELLAGYGDRIRRCRLEENSGFARACNRGAELARGGLLVFLNNDVEPLAGWLEALRAEAAAHPAAAVVGAKLLYPNGTVQHAGVVFGQDGYPHHLYAGFSGDHPVVNRSRPLQAVTAACMLVRRTAFEAAGGFDAGFHNSLEDVDLCLRIGEAGGEVRYCHEAALVHLESASRGRSDRFERSVALYRDRWRQRVRRDDLEVYVADGLLRVEYGEAYPARISVEPLLAVVDRGREEEIERLLDGYAGQAADLLQEVVRLSAATAGIDGAPGPAPENGSAAGSFDRSSFLSRVRELEAHVRELQAAAPPGRIAPGERLGYGRSVEIVRSAVQEAVPAGARVLVVSRGDRELLRVDGRSALHFPQGDGGGYAGHHPADSAEAIAELERLRADGAEYLVFPPTARWWLDHYSGFAAHLAEVHRRLPVDGCEIYELRRQPHSADDGNTMPR